MPFALNHIYKLNNMKNKRESGYYWVKKKGKWVLSEYDSKQNLFWLICNEFDIREEELEDIIEERIKQPQNI